MDSKFFTKGKAQELKIEITDRRESKRKNTLKRIVANMMMGNDMTPLAQDIVDCGLTKDLEVKKLVYYYLIFHAHVPGLIMNAHKTLFQGDIQSDNTIIRGFALRNITYIKEDIVKSFLVEKMLKFLTDKDPYVAKSSSLAFMKLHFQDLNELRKEDVQPVLDLLQHENGTVISNACAVLNEMVDRHPALDFELDISTTNNLLTAIDECTEWGQIYILETILHFVPFASFDAELMADRISSRLQHSNSGVVLGAVRAIIYLINYIEEIEPVYRLLAKVAPPLVTLMTLSPQIQFVALQNIEILLQIVPEIFGKEYRIFFCKYNDPIYVKLSKIEVLKRLATPKNLNVILQELKEYASEVDLDFINKAVRTIGYLAVHFPQAADECVEALVDLIKTGVDYILQESVIVMKNIFRKYPSKYEKIIALLCENIGVLDDPNAKASLIWILGHYSEIIENADELLEHFTKNFKDEAEPVQYALLNATVQLFLRRPAKGQALVPAVLRLATEEVDNPDLRDRGFIYWRLLSNDPVAAKVIVLDDHEGNNEDIDVFGDDEIHSSALRELLLNISTLVSVYQRPLGALVGGLANKKIKPSASLVSHRDWKTVREYAKMMLKKPAHSRIQESEQNNGSGDGMAKQADDGQYEYEEYQGFDSSVLTSPSGNHQIVQPSPIAQPSPGSDLLKFGSSDAGSEDEALRIVLGVKGNHSQLNINFKPQPYPIQTNSQTIPVTPILPIVTPPPNYFTQSPTQQSPVSPVYHTPQQRTIFETKNSNFVIDPFSRRANDPTPVSNKTTNLFAYEKVLDSSISGSGYNVFATWSRLANSDLLLHLKLVNVSPLPMSEISTVFDRNSFGLAVASPILSGMTVDARSEQEIALNILTDFSSRQNSIPLNAIRIAVKSNFGIHTFNCNIGLQYLFEENVMIDEAQFLHIWLNELPPQGSERELQGVAYSQDLITKLRSNYVQVVAQALIDHSMSTYLCTRIMGNVVFLSQILFQPNLASLKIISKSFAASALPLYEEALIQIMKQ